MYEHKIIEKKWQKIWQVTRAFRTTDSHSKKYYVLDMFPYPSGSGLHVGHPEGYTATDIIARYKRLRGYDVLHPIGWDAFGLPAEQYAIQTGNHPAQFTEENIVNFRKQLQSLGFSFDYQKEVNTTDPKYYKWTQWIFSAMYKKGLAELRDIEVNWCEELGTVLANEEVLINKEGNSVSERGEFPVVKKLMKQWVLKITDYAQQLHDDLDGLDWPSGLIALQKNWIFNEDGSLHLRDWVFSRQRYWGEPFPIAFDPQGQEMLIEDLPVELPQMDEIRPSGTGESPLANNKSWLYFEKNSQKWRRETNTMPQWAGSSWYYLAYIMKNDDGSFLALDSSEAKKRIAKWMPVDLYVGGQEHATLHLLYARFWHKVLYDLGIVNTKEPFQKIVNQGMILGPNGQKMSKSKGNVINPDQIINIYGADTLRVYEMFMGPLVDDKPWSTDSLQGVRKWLDRVERMYDGNWIEIDEYSQQLTSEFHSLVKEVTADLKALKFNTMISKLMVFVNLLYKVKVISSENVLRDFAIMLSTVAPHLSEELLEKSNQSMIKDQVWPTYNQMLIKEKAIIVAVQINGKLKHALIIKGHESQKQVREMAVAIPKVAQAINAEKVLKEIYLKHKVLNFVTTKK